MHRKVKSSSSKIIMNEPNCMQVVCGEKYICFNGFEGLMVYYLSEGFKAHCKFFLS